MNAKEILMNAVQCDKAGRILEAQSYYQEGIQILMDVVAGETDADKKKVYYERIKEYIDRAEQIQLRVQSHTETGAVVAHIPIDDNSTGHSYNTLFGQYLNSEVKEILLVEPYLIERYQFKNLVAFLELAVKKCSGLKYIRLVTKEEQRNSNGQLSNLKQIKEELKQRGVNMSIIFDPTLHDRKIVLGSGYIIKIGRGLHYFKATNSVFSLGICDYDYRKCLQTDVDIWKTKAIS